MNEATNYEQRWKILGILGIAQLMVVLDAAVMNIALPSAQSALHFPTSDRQWIVTAYALAFGSLLLLGGRISDLFGRKRALLIGLGGFALASAVGGAAQSFVMLTVARACQGAFGAVLAPAALSLLTTTFTEPTERNKAFGVYAAIAGSGASVGLILGGVLTQYLSWRYSMYVNLVFAAIAITGATILVRHEPPAERPHLDLPGTLTVSAGLFCLVFGFSHAQSTSWGDPATIAFLVASPLLLGVFVWMQTQVAHPLLPLRVITDRTRGGSFISITIVGAATFALLLFISYYLQQDRGYSPLTTGLAFLPMTAVVVVTSMVSNIKLRSRFGPRRLVVAGMILGGLAMADLSRLGLHTTYALGILPAAVLAGIGLGLVMSTAMNSATFGVAATDAGVASASVSASQQIGGSLGASLFSTIAASAAASYLAGQHTIPHAAGQAAVHGYDVGFAVAAATFAVGAIAAVVLIERTAPAADQTVETLAAM